MIHPHTELRFINDDIGHGVVATAFIPRGTITWVLDDLDQILVPERVAAMAPPLQALVEKYAYTDGCNRHILCWDLARYVNHSCEATCLGFGPDFEIAVRDILPGEQLTDDYGGLNVEVEFPCACGSPGCRRVVRPDDVLRLADTWDAVLAACAPLVGRVEQPLWSLLPCKDLVRDVLDGRTRVPPSRLHHNAPLAGIRTGNR